MRIRSAQVLVACKLLVAAVAVVALVALPAKQMMPDVSTGDMLLYAAMGVAGVLALIVLVAICSLQFSQFILRLGGTDTQWFWFPGEPKGLVALRESRSRDGETRNTP
jgi:hypothetical protein